MKKVGGLDAMPNWNVSHFQIHGGVRAGGTASRAHRIHQWWVIGTSASQSAANLNPMDKNKTGIGNSSGHGVRP